LTTLFVGSEGTLGIITKIVIRLLPRFLPEILYLITFSSLKRACQVVVELKKLDITPSAVEIVDRTAIDLTSKYLRKQFSFVNPSTKAVLLIGLQEQTKSAMDWAVQTLNSLLLSTTDEVLIAETETQKGKIGDLRFNVGAAMSTGGKIYRDVDVCVPSSKLYDFLTKVKLIGQKHRLQIVCFGHASDGNVHTMIVLDADEAIDKKSVVELVTKEIYKYVVSLGGVISGEHGIGLLQKDYLPLQYSVSQIETMKRVKQLFDPSGILNPGKLIDYA
jgi:glycolate oxidase